MTVELVPIFLAERRPLVQVLGAALERVLDVAVVTRQRGFDPEQAYDASRGQYSSRRLLELLLANADPASDRVLGVAGVDLFVPVLTYVFGEAQLGGRAAVVSLHRLRPDLYGLPADERLLARRLVTEAVHELGHTWNLLHCRVQSCAMHASTYAEEIDLKTPELCPDCRGAVTVAPEGRLEAAR
jgi:archaemetzincin